MSTTNLVQKTLRDYFMFYYKKNIMKNINFETRFVNVKDG